MTAISNRDVRQVALLVVLLSAARRRVYVWFFGGLQVVCRCGLQARLCGRCVCNALVQTGVAPPGGCGYDVTSSDKNIRQKNFAAVIGGHTVYSILNTVFTIVNDGTALSYHEV